MKTRNLTRSSDFNSPRLLSVKNSATSLNKNSNIEKRKIYITPLIRCLADKNIKNKLPKANKYPWWPHFQQTTDYYYSLVWNYSLVGMTRWTSLFSVTFVGKIEIFLISVTIKIYRCLGSAKFFDLSQKCEILCIVVYNIEKCNEEKTWLPWGLRKRHWPLLSCSVLNIQVVT